VLFVIVRPSTNMQSITGLHDMDLDLAMYSRFKYCDVKDKFKTTFATNATRTNNDVKKQNQV